MKKISKQSRQKHLDFINANWPLLAGEAYRGFKEKGRGMLMVDESDFMHLPKGVFTKFSCFFIAEGTEEFALAGGKWPGQKESGWVKSYNPEKTLLIGFVRVDGGMSSYRIEDVGDSSVSMYQRLAARRN